MLVPADLQQVLLEFQMAAAGASNSTAPAPMKVQLFQQLHAAAASVVGEQHQDWEVSTGLNITVSSLQPWQVGSPGLAMLLRHGSC